MKPYRDLSKYPDLNLVRVLRADKAKLIDRAAAEVELERRRRWRDFWSKGIVAWIALAMALISLIWQIAKEY